MKDSSIKVGVIADQTGPLSFVGIANANVARMVIDDINAKGGLLGRRLDLYLEDSATIDSVAEAKATKLVQHDNVDVIFGGIYSSTRQAIKGPAVVKGKKLYIYPEQYEGQECDPLIFCTGPVPAQQVDPLIPWLMQQTGAKKFYLPSADYIWPHMLNKRVREVVTANGGTIVGEEYFPLDHADYAQTIEKITSSGADVVFNTIVPPGVTPFLEQLHDAGFTAARRTARLHLLRRELPEHGAGRARGGALQLPRLLPGRQRSVQPGAARSATTSSIPGNAKFTAGSACSGLYRGMKLWEAAVKEAGSLEQDDVIRALDHAKIAEGPGGPAEMVPGQHHVRMNMYIAQAAGGRFRIVEDLGVSRAARSAGAERRGPVARGGLMQRSFTPTHNRRHDMMLATTKVEDFDRFLEVFSTKGAEKRKQHGSKGAAVFRDPLEADRVWVIFDWDEQGFKNYLADPEVPAIIKAAGHVGKPQPAVLGGKYGA